MFELPRKRSKIILFAFSLITVWRKVFPLSNDLNTERELGALTLN